MNVLHYAYDMMNVAVDAKVLLQTLQQEVVISGVEGCHQVNEN